MLQGCFTETAVKVLDPDTKGSLDKRIDALAKVGKLPEAVGKWAHEVRFVGNEAAHEHDEPTRESIDAVGEFVEAFLQYTFTMPKKVANRLTAKVVNTERA